jgi:hypothetical protein
MIIWQMGRKQKGALVIALSNERKTYWEIAKEAGLQLRLKQF